MKQKRKKKQEKPARNKKQEKKEINLTSTHPEWDRYPSKSFPPPLLLLLLLLLPSHQRRCLHRFHRHPFSLNPLDFHHHRLCHHTWCRMYRHSDCLKIEFGQAASCLPLPWNPFLAWDFLDSFCLSCEGHGPPSLHIWSGNPWSSLSAWNWAGDWIWFSFPSQK